MKECNCTTSSYGIIELCLRDLKENGLEND